MIDIVKKRVIDWDNQLRKEKHFNEKFGTNLTPSEVKELTGSFRRLTDKSKSKIGDGTLEPSEEFYLSLDIMKKNQYSHICKNRSAAFYKIGDEPDSDKDNSDNQNDFREWDQKLDEFKSQNNWDKFIK
ncbi:MAG: hypothetical protein ISP96_01490 [Gammaproteobacteria bacterium]|nr:hypothetical protein [Gammaproteobacteria bacterium]MBL6898560.1 hypothetical protein [Gammaproteobacteria bacterium]